MFKLRSVRQKLLAGFGFVILLIVGIGTYNYYSTKQINERTEEIMDEQLPYLVSNATNVSTIANRLAVSRGYVLYDGKKEYRDRFEKYAAESKKTIEESGVSSGEFADAFRRVAALDEFIRENVFETYDKEGRKAAMRNLTETVEPEARELMVFFEKALKDREADIGKAGAAVLEEGIESQKIFLVISVAAVAASILIAFITADKIARPIREVENWMKSLASGDLTREPLVQKTEDEVGQLVVTTNNVNKKLRHIMIEMSTASELVSRQSIQLTESSNEVRTGSEQIAITMEELADGSEAQAERASELSGFMKGFSRQIAAASSSGVVVHEDSNRVFGLAEKGSKMMSASTKQMKIIESTVQDAVHKMGGLDAQAGEISKLIEVIKDISDQTNLLALNASIEAARAGVHGRGFAVVANEVGKLADQVGESVSDITKIVFAIQNETSEVSSSLQSGFGAAVKGSEQIHNTEETFMRIKKEIGQMANKIESMSQNLKEASSDSHEMTTSIQEIAAISEESAAGVEETSATAEESASAMMEVATSSAELEKLAERLERLVQQFKI